MADAGKADVRRAPDARWQPVEVVIDLTHLAVARWGLISDLPRFPNSIVAVG